MTLSDQVLDTVAARGVPRSALGARHPSRARTPRARDEWVVRARRPLAASVTAVFADGTRVPLEHVRSGIWEGTRSGAPGRYEIVTTYTGRARTSSRTTPTVTCRRSASWTCTWSARAGTSSCGTSSARTCARWTAPTGTAFAVWAPNAQAVRVVGDFNSWDGQGHAMRSMGGSGVWELFVPGLGAGTSYKFELLTGAATWVLKADPMARYAEVPPATASVVVQSSYSWEDQDWIAAPRRARRRSRSRCRCTSCTSARGGPGCPTATPRISSSTTSPRRASRTSSSCRSRSIRSADRGATRSPATTRRRAASATRTTCGT